MIMSGEVPIGAQLLQSDLAAKFNVSRTPIREALRQLQSGGLIEVLPHRGAVVRVPVPWEVREAYEVRAELEALAATRSVSRITREAIAELRTVNQQMYETSCRLAAGETELVPRGEYNDAFHDLIYAVSGNARLTRCICELNEAFPRNISALVLIGDSRYREENFGEHNRIVDAIEAGDADRARHEMHAHVLSSGERLASWYEQRSATVFLG